MMMMKTSVAWVCLVAAVVAAAFLVREGEGATCNPMELSPCIGAATSPSPASSECCSRLKMQSHCFCEYLRNPNFSSYINPTVIHRISTSCNVSVPSNCKSSQLTKSIFHDLSSTHKKKQRRRSRRRRRRPLRPPPPLPNPNKYITNNKVVYSSHQSISISN